LIGSGLIDRFRVMALVAVLEARYKVINRVNMQVVQDTPCTSIETFNHYDHA
jgi:hypothetical protein